MLERHGVKTTANRLIVAKALLTEGRPLSLMELDDDFHGMLFHIAQKDNICQMLSGMTIHFDRVRTLALNIVRDSKIISDHREICDAIAMKDVQRARDVMRKHLSRVKVDEEAIRKACPQYIRD